MTAHEAAREAVRLAGMATPGPWTWNYPGSVHASHASLADFYHARAGGYLPSNANAEFTAHAGTHYAEIASALLATAPEIARRDEEIRRLREALAKCHAVVSEKLHSPKGTQVTYDLLVEIEYALIADKIDAALSPEEKTK